MGKFPSVIMSMVLTVAAGLAQTGNPISLVSDGWTVTADGEQGVFSITHNTLGTVIKDARFNLRGEHCLRPLKNWSVYKDVQPRLQEQARHQLSIRTVQPQTGWLIELAPTSVKISSTTADGVLTAEAPASPDRVVARVLDPQGVPVTWVGTDAGDGWGVGETRNPSFLPTRNPECMYFAMGQVSGTQLHSLFDRKTDTVITFSDQAALQRDSHNPDLLDLIVPVPGNTLIRLVPDYYTKTLGLPFYVPIDDSYFRHAPALWCSWTSYYEHVTEGDIVQNADWIAKNLKPYGLDYILLDDGYDRAEKGGHNWIDKWDPVKFPHGPQWLANYIKSKGLRPALWLVPNAYAGAVDAHPEWYIRNKEGKLILDYDTPTLDHTNPDVLAFLRKLFTTLDDWGFEYYKLDGEFSLPMYDPAVDRDKLYDKTIDPIVAYRNRLALMRETVGPKVYLEAAPEGSPLNGIGYLNSYWNGYDNSNTWVGMHKGLSSINDNAFLNHIVTYLIPGEGIEVTPRMTYDEAARKKYSGYLRNSKGRGDRVFGTTLPEARTLVSYVALTGTTYSVSSILSDVPEERLKLLKQTLPPMPILPVDLFSRGTDMHYWLRYSPDYYIHNYPETLDLKVNAKAGLYDVVGLTNWRSETATRDLSFADKLGLTADSRYIAFDFWNQKLLGVFKDRMKVEIESHDTRVLLLHPLLNRPQLIGTSRHITGAYSILDLGWDSSKHRLWGSSQAVPGEAYTLWVYVPEGVAVTHVRAKAKGEHEVPAQHQRTGNSLQVTFQGQLDAVDWQLEFAPNTGK